MLISLSEIMTTKDKVEQIQVPVDLQEFSYLGETYHVTEADKMDLKITNLGNKSVLIEGRADISIGLHCDRCLKSIHYPIVIHITKEIDFNQTEKERALSLDETNYILGYSLDVAVLIKEEILMAFPTKLLCSEDCKGICKSCGANLNETTCDCDKTEYDPRMSVIRDMFNNFKEV